MDDFSKQVDNAPAFEDDELPELSSKYDDLFAAKNEKAEESRPRVRRSSVKFDDLFAAKNAADSERAELEDGTVSNVAFASRNAEGPAFSEERVRREHDDAFAARLAAVFPNSDLNVREEHDDAFASRNTPDPAPVDEPGFDEPDFEAPAAGTEPDVQDRGEAAEEQDLEAQDAYLHADVDLDEYLSFDEYEQREETPPESPEPRAAQAEPAAKKTGGLLGFLKSIGSAPARPARAEAALSAQEIEAGDYPDSDGAEEFSDETGFDTQEAFKTPEDGGRLYTVRSGAIGQKEQEARAFIAAMQAGSGTGSAHARRSSADYRVELDDLLDMAEPEGDDLPSPAADTEEPEDGDYNFDLEQALNFDEDVRPYRPKKETAFTPDAEEPEIDGRFHLGGQNPDSAISYGGSAVDLSADAEYVPAPQTEYNPSQWTPDYDDPLAEREDLTEPPRKQHRSLFAGLRRKSAEKAEQAPPAPEAEEDTGEAFSDKNAGPAIYAVSADYRDAPDDLDAPEFDDADFNGDDYEDGEGRKYRESDMYVPPSFREYLLSILASVWLRLRGTVRGRSAETMSDSEEDLGAELSPTDASKYYGSFLRSMKYRLRIGAVVLAVMLYISLEMPVPGMMKSLPVAAACCFGLQGLILLLSLDVVTNGFMNTVRLRFGADSLALVSCLFTGIDALIVALSESAAAHMPLCAISSASVLGLLLAAYLSARGLRKATRVPAIGKHFFAVTGENTLEKGEITLLKSLRSARGFVRRAEEAGPDETLYARLAPALFVLALLLSIIVMVAKKSYPEFLYILSAQLVLTVPFCAMLSFALPFFLGSTRIFKFGAAIAGWSGLCDIGMSKNLIVTDRDLFPESAVTIESVRIFADEDAQKVISYAGSMMQASGCCAAGCFGELMRETDSPSRPIDGFEVMPGGGMKGIIEGHVVLCGSTDLMRLMNVRIPFRLTDKTTVLLAIDGILYGIFSLRYEGQPQIRKALVDLVRTARPPVFAVRDFNVTPEMLHSTFDIATDGYDFPPYVERFRLSEPSNDVKDERISAILCNEGLAPLTSVADIGRSMYFATRVNLALNVIAAVLGVLLVFVRFLATGSNSFASLFLYMLFWALPVLAVSFFISVKR
ncbi:MAG: hypothetical protein IJT29_05195 [Oscillospiraceae bacterium]|nr:hypothetical protein [Oscillospiraceae bacterium]